MSDEFLLLRTLSPCSCVVADFGADASLSDGAQSVDTEDGEGGLWDFVTVRLRDEENKRGESVRSE